MKYALLVVIIIVLVGIVVIGYQQYSRNIEPSPTPAVSTPPVSGLSAGEAQVIAEDTCIKGGESLASGGDYNENTKTWWFDANLNSTPEGCNPACVVSEETKTAEINWRCTGLIPDTGLEETVKGLFLEKYGEDIVDTVTLSNSTETHMRGSVVFYVDPDTESEPEGGLFLAANVDGSWKLVYDGNGQIDCSLVEPYNFPEDMVSDCAE